MLPVSSSPYSVSQLNQEIHTLLESSYQKIWLIGEISNFIQAASGHCYFSLKDPKAQIKACLFKGKNRTATLPKNGDQVLVNATVSYYAPRGDCQLIINSIEPAGVGQLKQQFEQLKTQLHQQGYFDERYKRPIPAQLTQIGIITSSSGAAIHDVLIVLKRRAADLSIIIYPSLVQGKQADHSLIQAIELANERQEVDLLLLTRGGGSLEDLWCFNSPELVKAIFTSQLPIVSAVGHEVDVTLADFVSDLRAATPSAAAEIISTHQANRLQQLQQLQKQLLQSIQHQLQQNKQQLTSLETQLYHVHPHNLIQQAMQQLDEQQLRFVEAFQYHYSTLHYQLQQHTAVLHQHQPHHIIHQYQQQLYQQQQQLSLLIEKQLAKNQQQQQQYAGELNLLNPLNILSRGYSVTFDEQHRVIYSQQQLQSGDTLYTQLADGDIKSKVI